MEELRRPKRLGCEIRTINITGEIWKSAVGLSDSTGDPYEVFVFKQDEKKEVFYIHPAITKGIIVKDKFENHLYQLEVKDKQDFKVTFEGLDRISSPEFYNLTVMTSHLLRVYPVEKVLKIVRRWKELTEEQEKLQRVLIETLNNYVENRKICEKAHPGSND